jgi:outer membrane lipoprotein carrier protein
MTRIANIGGLTLLVLVVALGTVTVSHALPDVHAVARAVDDRYNHMQTLEADFTEIYQGAGIERSESGTVWLKKPGKMRWTYRSPVEKLFVSDGKSTWLYLPAEKQVRRSSLKSLEDLRSPLAFLLGKSKLEKELHDLSFAPDIQAWQRGDSMLSGVPRGMEDRVRQVLIEVTPEHRIARLVVEGIDDSVTEYRFSNQKEDVALQDASFRFTPPSGAEIVEEQAQQ